MSKRYLGLFPLMAIIAAAAYGLYWRAHRYQYYRSGSGRDRYLEQACAWRKAKSLSCEEAPEHR